MLHVAASNERPNQAPVSTAASHNGNRTVPVAKAKAHLLKLLSEVDQQGTEVVITKRGRPVARLIPYSSDSATDIVGCMKGTFTITGDIVGSEADVWEAME